MNVLDHEEYLAMKELQVDVAEAVERALPNISAVVRVTITFEDSSYLGFELKFPEAAQSAK